MNVSKAVTFVMMVSLCLSTKAFAQLESSAVQKMKFACRMDADASNLFTEGTARMISSVEGIIEVEFTKGAREEGGIKVPMTVKLKYSMRLEHTTQSAGLEVSVSEGEIEKPSALYQHPELNTMDFSVEKNNDEFLPYVDMKYSGKMGGWTAHLTSFLNIPGSNDKMKSLNLRASIPCTMQATE